MALTEGQREAQQAARVEKRKLISQMAEKAKAAGLSPHAYLDRLANDVPAGSEGVVLLPYFLGEKTPIHDPVDSAVGSDTERSSQTPPVVLPSPER